jgi:hypothetical protein
MPIRSNGRSEQRKIGKRERKFVHAPIPLRNARCTKSRRIGGQEANADDNGHVKAADNWNSIMHNIQ